MNSYLVKESEKYREAFRGWAHRSRLDASVSNAILRYLNYYEWRNHPLKLVYEFGDAPDDWPSLGEFLQMIVSGDIKVSQIGKVGRDNLRDALTRAKLLPLDEDVSGDAPERYVVIHMLDTGDAIRLFEFQDVVTHKIKSGYVPCGGIVFSGGYMYQAVYLPEVE